MTGQENHYYIPLKQCMYCFKTEPDIGKGRFGDEHIIPLALGGNLILKESSCDLCAGIINKEIETPVLFKEWKLMRVKRDFPSRNKKKRQPKKVKLFTKSGETFTIPLKDYSTPVPSYKFITSRMLSNSPEFDNNKCWTMSVYTSHDEEILMKEKYPQWDETHRIMAKPYEFARLLAKIAHGRAVSEYGLEGFRPLGLEVILGKSDDYFNTVGGSLELEPAKEGGDHILDLSIFFKSSTLALLIVDIRLFSQIVSPKYKVVAGEINLENPEHLRCFKKHESDLKLRQ